MTSQRARAASRKRSQEMTRLLIAVRRAERQTDTTAERKETNAALNSPQAAVRSQASFTRALAADRRQLATAQPTP